MPLLTGLLLHLKLAVEEADGRLGFAELELRSLRHVLATLDPAVPLRVCYL